MNRYSVIQGCDVRFYAVDLDNTLTYEGHMFYGIVGFVGGYSSENEAWCAIERERQGQAA